jgi:hypothetical protein
MPKLKMRGALPPFTHALMACFLCISTTVYRFRTLFTLLLNSEMKIEGYENRDKQSEETAYRGFPEVISL